MTQSQDDHRRPTLLIFLRPPTSVPPPGPGRPTPPARPAQPGPAGRPRPAAPPADPAPSDSGRAAAAPKPAPPGYSRAALVLILVASFMVVLDFSIVNVALPSIQRELGFAASAAQWVVTGVRDHLRRAADPRRPGRGPVRPPPDVRDRADRLLRRLAGRRPGPGSGAAGRVAGGAGRGCGPGRPGGPVAHHHRLPRGSAGAPGRSACTARPRPSGSWPGRCWAASWSSSPAGARCSWSTCRSGWPRCCSPAGCSAGAGSSASRGGST